MEELATVLIAVPSSSVLSAAIAAIVSMRRMNREYENDHFKWVVEKRRKTYEMLDELMCAFRSSIKDQRRSVLSCSRLEGGTSRHHHAADRHPGCAFDLDES